VRVQDKRNSEEVRTVFDFSGSLACSCRADDLCARAEASSHPYKGLAAYSATKSFIESWSRGLRQVRVCRRCSGVGCVVFCVINSLHAVMHDDVCENAGIMPLIPKGRVTLLVLGVPACCLSDCIAMLLYVTVQM
jgi:hypothetical protein